MKKNLLVVVMVVGLFSVNSLAQSVIQVGAAQFKEMLEKNPGQLVDVRTSGEVARGHIAGMQNISTNDQLFEQKILKLRKDQPVYVYCLSGARSSAVARFLEQAGYKKVYNLQSGLIGWNGKGYPLVTESSSPAKQSLTLSQFKASTSDHPLVLVDFYASWCAPCKKMQPELQKLKNTYGDKLKIIKIDYDANQSLAKEIGVSAVPELRLYKNGKSVKTVNGFQSFDQMKNLVETSL